MIDFENIVRYVFQKYVHTILPLEIVHRKNFTSELSWKMHLSRYFALSTLMRRVGGVIGRYVW